MVITRILTIWLSVFFLTHELLAETHDASKILSTQGSVPIKLHVFDCGRITVRDMSLFNPSLAKGTLRETVNPCYLIIHPKGLLLWDTGLADELVHEKGGVETLQGLFHLSVVKTLGSQLADISVLPEDINYVAFSHLHNDHTGNAKQFVTAQWLIQKKETALAYAPDAAKYGYHPHDYSGLKDD